MDKIQIELIYATSPTSIWHQVLMVPENSRLIEAIAESTFACEFPDVDLSCLGIGVFGQKAGLQYPLKHGDRVELCRQLTFDPKESRKRRAIQRKAGILTKKHLKPDSAKKLVTMNRHKSIQHELKET